MLGVFLLACTSGSIVLGGEDTDTDTGELQSITSFESGRFRTTSLAILDYGEGLDLDGDGEIDNQTPDLLALLDPFTTDDLSRDGVNDTLLEMIGTERLVLLMDASYQTAVLTIDLLLASRDEETGQLVADPSSYDDAGNPTSHFSGEFADEITFDVAAATANLPFPVAGGGPPVLIPMAEALLSGSMHNGGANGLLAGSLPVQGMVDQVVEPLIPAAGPDGDYDPDDFLGMSREDFIEWIGALLEENIADLWLEDGSRAISAALSWEVDATDEWPD